MTAFPEGKISEPLPFSITVFNRDCLIFNISIHSEQRSEVPCSLPPACYYKVVLVRSYLTAMRLASCEKNFYFKASQKCCKFAPGGKSGNYITGNNCCHGCLELTYEDTEITNKLRNKGMKIELKVQKKKNTVSFLLRLFRNNSSVVFQFYEIKGEIMEKVQSSLMRNRFKRSRNLARDYRQ